MPRLGSFQAVESGWRGKGKKDHECWDGFLSWHHTACSSSNRGAQKPGQNFTNASNIDSGVRPSWRQAGCGHAQRDPIEQMSLTMGQETLGQGTGHKTDDPSQGTGAVPCSWLLCLITDPATPCPQKWLARSQHRCVCGASCCQRTAPSNRKLSCEVKLQRSTSYVLGVCSHLSPLSLHALNGKLIPLVRSSHCKHHLPLTPETI